MNEQELMEMAAAVAQRWTSTMVCYSELSELAREMGAQFHESWQIADIAADIILSEED